MRDLKTLLELLLSEWEDTKYKDKEYENYYSGFCSLLFSMWMYDLVLSNEYDEIERFIKSHMNYSKEYLFKPFAHNERVEWLKERIKELEK